MKLDLNVPWILRDIPPMVVLTQRASRIACYVNLTDESRSNNHNIENPPAHKFDD